jgi:ribosomal protein S15P/S13E
MELTEQVSDAHHNNTMHEMMDSNSHTMMHDSTMNDSTMNSTKNHMNTNLNKVESSIVVTQDKFSTDEIVKKYLSLKNALTKDDAKTSSSIAKNIINIITNMDINSVDVKKQKDYTVLVKNIKEHATHISDNAKDIEHQRTHFELLSNDFSSLIETFGSSQKLYQDFCPMYHEGKGAYWISEMKEIKNPYYGSQMLSCGSLKKEL